MDSFVRDVLAMPPLDAAEERELARLARAGDVMAREALITAGMRPVVMRARLRGLRGEELRDAVQSGAVGLIRAVDRFDPDRGVRLATYAWHWIGAAMTVPSRPEVPLEEAERWSDGTAAAPGYGGKDLLAGLPAEQADVLRLRFGLECPPEPPRSRRLVAERLGLSVGRVRTIEATAMRHLHARLANVDDRAPRQRGVDPL